MVMNLVGAQNYAGNGYRVRSAFGILRLAFAYIPHRHNTFCRFFGICRICQSRNRTRLEIFRCSFCPQTPFPLNKVNESKTRAPLPFSACLILKFMQKEA